jgi:hypothetical protein
MTIDERLERLTSVVETLAASVAAHDDQIEALIKIAEEQRKDAQEQRKDILALNRRWEAYLNTIRPQ